MADEMGKVIADASAAAKAASDAAAATESTAAVIVTLVPERYRGDGKRLVFLWLLYVALLTSSVFLITQGTKAFSAPEATPATFGNVSLALEATAPFEDIADTYISAYFYEGGRSQYVVWLPEVFRNKSFVVLYEDAAVMAKVGSDTGLVTVTGPSPCRETIGEELHAVSRSHMCQIVRGRVPSDGWLNGPCEPGPADRVNYIAIEIHGMADIYTDLNWAHELISTPSLVATMPFETFDKWNGIRLDGSYGMTHQNGCKVVQIPVNSVITDSDAGAVRTLQYSIMWQGDSAIGDSAAVAKSRSAESWGNVLIATGGIVAGFAIGFLMEAREATHSWRRVRKHRLGGKG